MTENTGTDERNAWDRMEGEPSLWYQRFTSFRLLGVSRSVLATCNKERVSKSRKESSQSPGSWRQAADRWRWYARAEAWDKYLSDQASAQFEAEWKKHIMGEVEALGRMSAMGRVNIGDFITLNKACNEITLNDKAIKENGWLVKKISTSRGKTNSVSIEVYDAQTALQSIGRRYSVFSTPEDREIDERTFSLPADVIAPNFLDVYDAVRERLRTEFVLYGGRGSTKSSFISLVIVYLIKTNPGIHAVAMRQVKDTLRDSVYSQIKWAISELGLDDEFRCTTSPLEITYTPTGQKIYFRGADDPGKLKSIKTQFGYIAILWLEELDQFFGPESVRKIEQSVIRGGDISWIFKSFNPPATSSNWVNKYVKIPKQNQFLHKSTYLDLGSRVRWLGKTFIDEAEHLKIVNPRAYDHEYLGNPSGDGGVVFENVELRAITDDEISRFDHICMGVDWGYYPDPYAWGKVHYDAARMTLYIFDELHLYKQSNQKTYEKLVTEKGVLPGDLLIADSAEPKSVADYRSYGLNARGAEKGPDSVDYSIKWLQSLTKIVIDPERCPETAREFVEYEYLRDKDGNVISGYPDKNNHHIDKVRYATNLIWRTRGQ